MLISTAEEVQGSELLELGRKHLEVDTHFASAEALPDHLIELISVRNLRHRLDVVCPVLTVLAETLFAEDLPLLGPGTPTTHLSSGSLGGCYSDLMDLPLYLCYHVHGQPYEPRVTIAYFLRHMTISTMCEYSEAICRFCCFQTRVWSIR